MVKTVLKATGKSLFQYLKIGKSGQKTRSAMGMFLTSIALAYFAKNGVDAEQIKETLMTIARILEIGGLGGGTVGVMHHLLKLVKLNMPKE